MSRIAVLDELTANQIAAGEVVERPASVVKELVENSLDAGADVITVDVREEGTGQITVVDNGCGMDEEDARLAFLRYATSKIRHAGDLGRITTMGFRGEALPSIAAVSKVKLKTKTPKDNAGTYVEIQGGKFIACRKAGAAIGTSITVEDLFFNTPARLKHLKKWTTESGLIGDFIYRLAISRPAVKIRFIHNGREVFSSPGSGRLVDVLAAIYGVNQAKEMLLVKYENSWLSIEGYVSRPSVNRSSRRQIMVVINNRYIRNPMIVVALQEAYQTMLPGDRYPVAAIHLNIDPSLIDVNIHPAKMEIRLSHEKEIFSAVRQSVRETLHTSLVIPGSPMIKSKSSSWVPQVSGKNNHIAGYINKANKGTFLLPSRPEGKAEPELFDWGSKPGGLILSEPLTGYERKDRPFPFLQIIGQLLPTYILGSGEEGLFLIDQHAAHERVLYEDFLSGMSGSRLASQMLLTPLPLHLSRSESQTLSEYRDFLISLGFEMGNLSGDDILLRGVPVDFPAGEVQAYFQDILDYLASPGRTPDRPDALRHLTATAACRAAIKSGSKLTVDVMEMLLKKLALADNSFTCPHGRPTIIMFSFAELARRFLRT